MSLHISREQTSSVSLRLAPARKVGAKPRVLIVETDRIVRAQIAMAVRGAGFETISASTLAEGLALLALNPNCVIVGVDFPDGSGAAFLREVQSRSRPIPVALAGVSDDGKSVARLQPDAVFLAPVEPQELCRWLTRVLGQADTSLISRAH